MEERRKLGRSLCYLDIIDPATGKLLGNANDINHGGLMLISKDEIPLQTDIPVCVDIPNNDVRIQLVINGVWNQINRNPDFYNTGCRIVSASTESINAIISFYETLKKSTRNAYKFMCHSASA